jgi:hypothetical protein
LEIFKQGNQTMKRQDDTVSQKPYVMLGAGRLVASLWKAGDERSGWTENPLIRHASSIIDYIFRWLGLQFSDAYTQEKLAADNALSEVSEQQSLAVQAGQADG